ncbi:MAG: STAS domain-containing protein [Pseudomonadales bacterium]|nr:STAS domain-containing protein [Pseudomonadales bacterium]
MLSGKMLYAVHGGTYVIQLCGDVRVPMCSTLDHFLDDMFQDPVLSSVLIDLCEADGVDSTTLGLLAKISVSSQAKFHQLPTIISTRPDISRILESMGFESVFNIVHERPDTSAHGEAVCVNEVPSWESSDKEVSCKVLEAHRTLMQLNEKNKDTFKNVVEALEAEQSIVESHV